MATTSGSWPMCQSSGEAMVQILAMMMLTNVLRKTPLYKKLLAATVSFCPRAILTNAVMAMVMPMHITCGIPMALMTKLLAANCL